MQPSGEGLVVVLGWGIEEFEASCREASKEALEKACHILSQDDPHEPEWITERSRYGVRFIRGLLKEKGVRDEQESGTD